MSLGDRVRTAARYNGGLPGTYLGEIVGFGVGRYTVFVVWEHGRGVPREVPAENLELVST